MSSATVHGLMYTQYVWYMVLCTANSMYDTVLSFSKDLLHFFSCLSPVIFCDCPLQVFPCVHRLCILVPSLGGGDGDMDSGKGEKYVGSVRSWYRTHNGLVLMVILAGVYMQCSTVETLCVVTF